MAHSPILWPKGGGILECNEKLTHVKDVNSVSLCRYRDTVVRGTCRGVLMRRVHIVQRSCCRSRKAFWEGVAREQEGLVDGGGHIQVQSTQKLQLSARTRSRKFVKRPISAREAVAPTPR